MGARRDFGTKRLRRSCMSRGVEALFKCAMNLVYRLLSSTEADRGNSSASEERVGRGVSLVSRRDEGPGRYWQRVVRGTESFFTCSMKTSCPLLSSSRLESVEACSSEMGEEGATVGTSDSTRLRAICCSFPVATGREASFAEAADHGVEVFPIATMNLLYLASSTSGSGER